MTLNRRNFAKLGVAAVATVGSRGAWAADEKPLKVAFLYNGPAKDGGWTEGHDRGRLGLEKALGDKIKTSFIENVPESADAERVLNHLVDDGNKLIFATSFGYMEPVLKVAKNFPDVVFLTASAYKTAPNVGAYTSRFYEGAYLQGIIAAGMTKSNTLGYVASFPVPPAFLTLNAYTLGARSVNPQIKTKVVWVNTWYDPGKERQATEAMIAGEADVFAQITGSPASLIAAQEHGVYGFGWDSDMSQLAPKAQLTASTTDWSIFYIETVNAVLQKRWKSGSTLGGARQGWLKMSPLNPIVPEAAAKRFATIKNQLTDGSFSPFAGPIKDSTGKVRFASGSLPNDGELYQMSWYVEGVEGAPPT